MADEITTGGTNTPEDVSYETSISNPDTEPTTSSTTPAAPTEGGTPTTASTTPTPEFTGEEFVGFHGFGSGITVNQSKLGTEVGGLEDYVQNVTMDNAYHAAAVNQSPMEAIGNGLYRGIVGEIVGGTLAGFGALGNMMADGEYNDRNWLEDVGNALMEGANEDAEIYERNPGAAFQWGDGAWWAKNIPSMLSTVSMMIPGAAVGKGASLVGRGMAKLGRAAAGGAKAGKAAANAAKVEKFTEASFKTLGGAVGMRHAENMREAHGAFETAREEFLDSELTLNDMYSTTAWKSFVADNDGRKPANKQELADYVGGAAAKKAYSVNNTNLVFDLVQMHALGKIMKGTRGAFKGRTLAKASGAAKGAIRRATLKDLGTFALMDMGTEGVEEAVNFVGTEEGLHAARQMYNPEEVPSSLEDRLREYTHDDHLWESAFLGALGGAVFTGVGQAKHKLTKGKAGNQQVEDAVARGVDLQNLLNKTEDGTDAITDPAEAAYVRREAMFKMGRDAAQRGQADVAENQIALYEQTLRNEGASETEIKLATEEMREQFAAAEAAVQEANDTALGLGLSGTEAGVLKQQIVENTWQQQEVTRELEAANKEIAGLKNLPEQQQQAEKDILADMEIAQAAMEAQGIKIPTEAVARLKALRERVAAHPTTENVVDEAAVTAAQETVDAATAKVEELRAAIPNQQDNQAAKSQLAEELAVAFEAQTEAQAALATAQEGVAPAPIKYNSNVRKAIEAQNMLDILQENRTRLTTEEGIMDIQKLAAKIDETVEAKNEKEFKETVAASTSQRDLKALLRKEDDSARKELIKDRLQQLENEEKNPRRAELEERSKDIPVPPAVQSIVDQLMDNSDNVALNEEGSHYVDKRTGRKYMRTTSWMKGETTEAPFDASEPFYYPSTNIGNSIDEYVRDYFDGNIRGPEAYPHLPAELVGPLTSQLENLEREFLENGEKVIAKDVILFNDMEVSDTEAAGVAGTVDLLTVDAEGNFRVYDMKTIRDAVNKKKVIPLEGGTAIYGKGDRSFNGGLTLEQKHQKQLSAYRMMLMNQFGVNVPDIGIIPIEVFYEDPKNLTQPERQALVTERASYLGMIAHTPLTELNGLTEPEVGGVKFDDVPSDPDPDPSGNPDPTKPEDGKPELSGMTVSELKAIARAEGITGYSKLRKAELIDTILAHRATQLTLDENQGDEGIPTPSTATNITLEGNAVAFPLDLLVAHFATQLEVMFEPGREAPYMVHAHEGPVRMTGEQLAAYQAVQAAINGTSSNVTLSVEATGKVPTKKTEVYTNLKDVDRSNLQTGSRTATRTGQPIPNLYEYTPTVGDSLVIKLSIDGVAIGTLPTTAELMEAAHLAGQASNTANKFSRSNFEQGSRAGRKPVAAENTTMMMQQEAALENANAMHALRLGLYEAQKEGLTNVAVTVTPGQTGQGQVAQGGLIYSKGQGVSGSEYQSVRDVIMENGIALQLPAPSGKGQVIELHDKTTVAAYQQNETGTSQKEGIVPKYNSGAMYVPLMNNGQLIYAKVPGRTMSDLKSSKKIIGQIITTLESGTDEQKFELQNILGSNALQKTEDGWAIFPSNQNRHQGVDPISVLRPGGWSTALSEVVPTMPLDIAITRHDGVETAFRNPDQVLGIGELEWSSLREFIADEVAIGYEPVLDADGEITGWTHTLAPVYVGRDTESDNRFVNHNTAATQLVMTVTPVAKQAVEKVEEVKERVSGNKVVEKLADKAVEESTTLNTDAKIALAKRLAEMQAKFGGGTNSDPVFLTAAAAAASNFDIPVTKEDMEVAEAWWAENVPQVPFTRVKGMIKRNGRTGYGIFQNGAVEVSNLAVVGTEFHEAFHAVFQMFLSDSRQEKVLKDARRMFGNKSDLLLEEDLAEHFREYMLTKGLSNKDKSVVRRFFSELYELITSLFANGSKGVRTTLLMQAMNRGAFANKDARVREYATRNKLIMADIPEYDFKVQQELRTSIKGNAFRAIRAAQKGKGSVEFRAQYKELQEFAATPTRDLIQQGLLTEDGLSKQEMIAEKLMTMAIEGPMIQDFTTILATSPEKSEQILKFLEADTMQKVKDFFVSETAFVKEMNRLVEQEFTAGTETQEQYDETFEKMNPKDSLSQTVRSLIETTPKISIQTYNSMPEVRQLMAAATQLLAEGNVEGARQQALAIKKIAESAPTDTYFGLPQMMDTDMVFPFLSQRLASKATIAEMFVELDKVGAVYPEFKLLSLKLQQEEAWVQSQFFAGFRRGDTSEMVQKKDYKGDISVETVGAFSSTLFTHNSVGISTRLHEVARKRNEKPAQSAQRIESYVKAQISKVDGMTEEQFVTTAQTLLNGIGFSTKDTEARDRVLSLKASDKDFRKRVFVMARDIAGGFAKMSTEENDGSSKQFNVHLQALSNEFLPYDMGSVSTTFSNVQDSRIYTKQVPSHITEWFDKFTKLHTEFKQHNNRETFKEAVKQELFQDQRMYHTTYGKMLFPFGPDGRFKPDAIVNGAMRSYRVGGVESAQGTTYTQMSDSDWIEFQIRSMDSKNNGIIYMPITTPSDATNSYMVPAIKYSSAKSGEVATKLALLGLIKAEVAEMRVHGGTFANEAVNKFMRDAVIREDLKNGNYRILDNSITGPVLEEATEILYKALLNEGKALMGLEAFQFAIDSINKNRQENAVSAQLKAQDLALTGYISNMSTGIALAGTHNEFKNSVDMQKRHKHIISPGLAASGLSGRTHFSSVTMTETEVDLTAFNEELSNYTNAKGEQVYSNVEIADAQSYVSLEFYKDILIEHGDMTPEKEVAIDKAIAGETLDAAEVKLLRPYKPFYYARTFNENTGLLESQQIKNSIIPILPTGLGENFSKLADWMADNGIDQVQMGTAHKVGKNFKKPTDLIDSDGVFNGKPLPAENDAKRNDSVFTLPMNGYRKQVNVTDHWHNDSTNKLASQLEKIIVAGAVRNMGEEGVEIANEFLETLDSIYAKQKDNFFKQFKEDNRIDGAFLPAEFAKWLKTELESDGTTPQYVLDMVDRHMFTAPAVVGLMRSRVFSAVNREVNSVRVSGGTQVQISSQFFRDRKDGGANRLKGVRRGKDENGNEIVLPAQVAVSKQSLPKTYKGLDIQSMSIEEIKAQAPELLVSITLRIPSEAMNSSTLVEITEFLPEGMDGIIVPDEFVTQMGSDFDVDKLFFQFRGNNKANEMQDKLFDLQAKVLSDPRMLAEILEPQGFDSFSDLAKDPQFQMRAKKQTDFITNNPMSVSSQSWMRDDNMSGVALKGKAANKNVILLDLVRYGWKWKSDQFKIDGSDVAFDAAKVSPEVISIHAQAVAAAMDGAKDPVYGKLGITDKNFGMFMELVMFADQTLTKTPGKSHERNIMEFALNILQSQPAQLEARGHIRIMPDGDKGVKVIAKTEKGEKFLQTIAPAAEGQLTDGDKTLTMGGNNNFFSDGKADTKSVMFMTKAIGSWKREISANMRYVNSVMRSDKTNVGQDIESQLLVQAADKGNYGQVKNGLSARGVETREEGSGFTALGYDAHLELNVKQQMHAMYKDVSKTLADLGDGYYQFKQRMNAVYPKIASNLTVQQYDAYKRGLAAAEAANQEEHTAMGERTTRLPGALGEDPSVWSLNDWMRHFGAMSSEEINEDLQLVLSKLLPSVHPYNMNGKYFDNISLIGVADDGELKVVVDAMERLYDSQDPDTMDFITAIQEYEAQRSGYQGSQSRLTRILPSAIHQEIAEKAGAAGVVDMVSDESDMWEMLRTSIPMNSLPYMGAKTNKEAIETAESENTGKVYRTLDGQVLVPTSETEGEVKYDLYAGTNIGPKGRPLKANGKPVYKVNLQSGKESETKEAGDAIDYFSKQTYYKPEMSQSAKVALLQQRFRRSGINVKVIVDPSLSANGSVRIEKGEATVRIHPDKLQGDTIAHEFGHILVEALGYQNPLVQQAIAELKGTQLYKDTQLAYSDLNTRDLEMEVLVTFLGRKGTDLVTTEGGKISKLKTIYNKIMRAIGKLLGVQPKATEQLAQELMFGSGELSLDATLNTVQEQRGTKKAGDIIKSTAQNLKGRMDFIRETQGTSVEAQEALDEARARYEKAAGGSVLTRLDNIINMTDDTVGKAIEATTILDSLSTDMRAKRTLNGQEVLALNRADQTLNDVETLIQSLENMETLKKDLEDMTDQEIAFNKLADKIDILREAKNNLTGAVKDAVSNKLKAQSTNKTMLEQLGDDNMFDMVSNPELRALMTDVDAISKGALGIKEFKNPVAQSIAKLVADTLETARLDGRKDEAQIDKILKDFKGDLSEIVDMETGALKGQFSASYYEELRQAEVLQASGKDPLALSKFHAENTVQEHTKEYHTNWTLRSEQIQQLRARIRNQEGQLQARGKARFGKERMENLQEMRRQFAELMRDSGPNFLKFHDVVVSAEFEAAHNEAILKVEAAKAKSKEDGTPIGPDFYALQNFEAEHVVIKDGNGKAIPTRGKFAEVNVKEEYKNTDYTGEETPDAKFINEAWATNPHKKVISDLKAVLANAAGKPGEKFVERGFLPLGYESKAGKTVKESVQAEGKRIKKAVGSAAGAAAGQNNSLFGNKVSLDARGNAIYVRHSGLFKQPTEEQVAKLKTMTTEDVSNRLRQFVKDAHQEQAKQKLEPIAYLTREVFEGSEIIDGRHVLKPGKKGERMRTAKKLAKGSNIAESMDQWFEGVLGDNWEDKGPMDDAAALIQQYTSLMGVGLNIPAWINNFAYGSLQKNLEFRGRDHFSKENNKKARGLIGSNFTAIIGDLVKDHKGRFTNKVSAIIHTLDVADDQRELPFNQRESMASKAISHAFIGQTIGEIAMQNQVLFAMMLETKVKLADGTSTNLLDAYKLVDGVLTLPKDAQVETAQGEMVDLNNEYVARLRNKVKSINHYIHGAYNKQDAGTWQRHWLGRLAMQFRRWLPMGIKKRFGERMHNESREREEMGEYRALANIVTAVTQQGILGDGNIKEVLEGLKEDKVLYESAKKALREMAISAGLFLALAALYAFGMDDDDEMGVIGALAVNRTERLAQEMMTYTPMGMVKLFGEMTESPIASWGKVQTMGQLLMYSGQDGLASAGLGDYAVYKSGSNKGESKTMRKLTSVLPLGSHYQRFMDIEQNHKEYSMLYNFLN